MFRSLAMAPPYTGDIQAKFNLERLRDEFAMRAMQGLLSTEYYRGTPHNFVADESYRFADAMLAARNNKEQ